jgi:hypothetical protein
MPDHHAKPNADYHTTKRQRTDSQKFDDQKRNDFTRSDAPSPPVDDSAKQFKGFAFSDMKSSLPTKESLSSKVDATKPPQFSFVNESQSNAGPSFTDPFPFKAPPATATSTTSTSASIPLNQKGRGPRKMSPRKPTVEEVVDAHFKVKDEDAEQSNSPFTASHSTLAQNPLPQTTDKPAEPKFHAEKWQYSFKEPTFAFSATPNPSQSAAGPSSARKPSAPNLRTTSTATEPQLGSQQRPITIDDDELSDDAMDLDPPPKAPEPAARPPRVVRVSRDEGATDTSIDMNSLSSQLANEQLPLNNPSRASGEHPSTLADAAAKPRSKPPVAPIMPTSGSISKGEYDRTLAQVSAYMGSFFRYEREVLGRLMQRHEEGGRFGKGVPSSEATAMLNARGEPMGKGVLGYAVGLREEREMRFEWERALEEYTRVVTGWGVLKRMVAERGFSG